jgi:hypothetical protein
LSNDINPHIAAEELEGYSLGHIPEQQAGRLEEHLLICDTCRQRLEENDSYNSAMRQAAAQLQDSPARPERRPWSFPRLLPATVVALACIVLAAGAALGVALRGSNSAAPPFAVNLAATRGAGIEAKAPAGRTLALRPDLTGLAFRLEMVDRLGNRVWQGSATAQGLLAGTGVPRQLPGIRVNTKCPSAQLPAFEVAGDFGTELAILFQTQRVCPSSAVVTPLEAGEPAVGKWGRS